MSKKTSTVTKTYAEQVFGQAKFHYNNICWNFINRKVAGCETALLLNKHSFRGYIVGRSCIPEAAPATLFQKGTLAQVFSSEFFKRSIFSYRKPPWLLLNAVTTQNIWLYLQKNIILLRQICSVGKLKKPVLLYVNDKRSCFAFFVGLLDT